MNDQSPSEGGEDAAKPTQVSRSGWKAIGGRVKTQIKTDHIQLLAAGVAFYFFLAAFPALAAAVSIYGLVVDPAQAEAQIEQMASLLPEQARAAISEIAQHVAGQSEQALGWGLALSILLSLWSANKGTKALFEGLNIAYNEEDERGFLKQNATTLLFTLTAVVAGLLALVLVAGFPAISGALGLPDGVQTTLNVLRWPVAALLAALLIAYAYRAAPDREPPRWRWINWGSLCATALWLLVSAVFSLYASNFGGFGGTYGSFATVVVLMLWLFLSAFVVLLGAELNSELERQTARDTTRGPDKPLGQRGAYHADHVPSQRHRGGDES